MKKTVLSLLLFSSLFVFSFSTAAFAHFGMVIPSDPMVMPDENRSETVTLSFSHPMEMVGMDLARPAAFILIAGGEKSDLTAGLKPARVMGHAAWQATVPVRRPGAMIFAMTPEPYWEPAEDVFIIHYTKTVAAAFGDEEGWDAEIGLPVEIVPLTRPFGLYAGNVFSGIVKKDGKPVPFAEVEVEFYNQDGKAKAPTDYMITQVVKAGPDGVFHYAAPKAGWWGFAALMSGDTPIVHPTEGKKGVELGAVMWVHFEPWSE